MKAAVMPEGKRVITTGAGSGIAKINPARRYGQPTEIGKMACFLLSDRVSYVNEQAIPIDGDLSASRPGLCPKND